MNLKSNFPIFLNIFLLLACTGVNAMGKLNKYADIFEAAKNGNIESVKEFLDQKTYINSKDNNKNTALHHAAYNGHLELVKYLIKTGAHINKKNKNNYLPLQLAAEAEHTEIVKFIFELRAGYYDLCKLFIHIDEETAIKIVQISPKKTFVKREEGCIPLYYAIKKNYLKLAKTILSLDPTIADDVFNNHTFLILATYQNNPYMIKIILDHATNASLIDWEDDWKFTALTHAVRAGKAEAAKMLLIYGANSNQTDKYGESLSEAASAFSSFHILPFLHPKSVTALKNFKKCFSISAPYRELYANLPGETVNQKVINMTLENNKDVLHSLTPYLSVRASKGLQLYKYVTLSNS